MRKFWLLDQHDGDGPTALVQTDGRLQIVDVLRFGPSITALEDQQTIFDEVIGRVAPTLKPCVKDSEVDEEGVAPHVDLQRGDDTAGTNRTGRRAANQKASGQRQAGGPSRTRSRGER